MDNLFEIALTHASWTHEHGGRNNERLEFLGDAVLELCVSELLFERLDEEREGGLSQLRARLVNKHLLADLARELQLHEGMRVGAGRSAAELRHQDKPLSDAWEALLGAVYLDLGFAAARQVVEATVLPRLDRVEHAKDPKTRLQEWSQQHHGGEVPAYAVVERTGPDHAPVFVVAVTVAGRELGRGEGRSKKAAAQSAATAALERLS